MRSKGRSGKAVHTFFKNLHMCKNLTFVGRETAVKDGLRCLTSTTLSTEIKEQHFHAEEGKRQESRKAR